MIKAVLFDVDGVLIDSFRANYLFYKAIAKDANINVSRKEYEKHFGRSLMDSINIFFPKENKAKKLKRWKRYANSYHKFHKYVRLNPNAKRILSYLKGNYKIGIVTSRVNCDVLRERGIDFKMFDVIIMAKDFKKSKSHPEALLKAVKKLKIKPNEAIYIGDMKEDVGAARNAGMKSIILGNRVKGTYNITNLKQIKKHL